MDVSLTNLENYSLSIAVWLADDDYADDRPVISTPNYISVTGLLKPLRVIVLGQRVRKAMEEAGTVEVMDLARFVPSRLGSAIHSAIEHSWTRTLPDGRKAYAVAMQKLGYPKNVIDKIRINPTEDELDTVEGIIPVFMEQRTTKIVGNWTIGGKFDFIGNGNLEDFKSMGVYGYRKGDKDEEQQKQGSLYRWLNPDIVKSDIMKVQQIFTDWSKLDAMKFGNSVQNGKFKLPYPQTRILEKQLALEVMDQWVENRIAAIDRLLPLDQAELPRCTSDELWQDPPTFKYYKDKAKAQQPNARSTKNFDNYSDAHARFMKDGSTGAVVEVPAKVKRCAYCEAADICTQRAEYEEQGILHTI